MQYKHGSVYTAGRVGSAFAAELGTMQVSEQTDSLRVLGTDPVDYLVSPRVLACMIAGPVLNILCFAMGELKLLCCQLCCQRALVVKCCQESTPALSRLLLCSNLLGCLLCFGSTVKHATLFGAVMSCCSC